MTKNIEPLLETPRGVEVCARTKDGVDYLFVMNHHDSAQSYDLGDTEARELLTGKSCAGLIEIEARGVQIFEFTA